MSDKLEARRRREAEIAAIALEMTTTEAKYSGACRSNYDIGAYKAELLANGENVEEIDDEEEEEENEEREVYTSASASSHIEASYGANSQPDMSQFRVPSIGDNEKDAEGGKVTDIDAVALERKVPLSHQVDLLGHSKAVVCLSIEPAGNRLVSGSLDYNVKMFDFGGMDTRHRPFFSIEVEDGHPVVSLAHSPSGDKFIVSTGSSQPRVYDREGKEIIKFVKGDMYLRDLAHTKGHVMEVTCVHWHPSEKNIVMTSSLDGTIRLWDLTGEAAFGNLINKSVLKIKASVGNGRNGCTSCIFAPNATRIFGGCADATIHIFLVKKLYSRADAVLKMPDSCKSPVTALAVSACSALLATRSEGGNITLWEVGKLPGVLLKLIMGVENQYSYANVEFSPDGSLLFFGTSPLDKTPTAKSHLLFFETGQNTNKASNSSSSSSSKGSSVTPLMASEAFMKVGVATGASVIAVKWQANTKQLLCSLSNGHVRVFFDPRFSVKGAMISAGKAPRREKDPTDFAIMGEIITPNALPLFRDPEKNVGKLKHMERKDPIKSKIPAKNLITGPGKSVNNSFFFTKYVSENRNKDDSRAEDPREALLKFDAVAKADPMFLGPAYQASQPATQFHTMTFEQEQEEFKKKQKKSDF